MLPFLEVIDDIDTRNYFNLLYKEYHQIMFVCAMKILKNQHDAEDALQQVLLRLWKYMDNVQKVSPTKMRSYLLITTKNHCLTLLKKGNSNTIVSIDEFPELEPMIENDPEIITIKNYDNRVLLDALNMLHPRYRQIILDKTVLHLNDEQTAEHIGIKTTYVRECLSRARSSLRKNYLELLSSKHPIQ
ncbi:RNA polymerase sigma factor [Huintestinicola sp.]